MGSDVHILTSLILEQEKCAALPTSKKKKTVQPHYWEKKNKLILIKNEGQGQSKLLN